MAFASTDDIAARLGESSLSEADEASAEMLLEFATAVIAQAVDKDDEWADALDPVPKILRLMTVELVCRAMASPQALGSATETLGAYSRSETYRRDLSTSLVLTDLEERMLRRAIIGRLSGSAEVESLASDVCTLCGVAPSLCGGEWLCSCEAS